MKRMIVFLFLGLAALLWGETVINGSRSILGTWDAGGAAATIPAKVGTALPATCAVGEQFFKSDAAAGQNIHLCTAGGVWTQVTGQAAGAEAGECAVGDVMWVCAEDEFISGSTSSGQIGALGWSHQSGTVSRPASVLPHYGVYRSTTGSTSGNNAMFWMSTNNLHGIWTQHGVVWEAKYIFRLSHTGDVAFRIGLGEPNASGLTVSRGLAVGGQDGNFHLFYGVGSGEIGSGAGLGVALNTDWNTLRFYTDGTERKVYVQMNSAAPVTLCSSGCTLTVPSGGEFFNTAHPAGPWFAVQTGTSAARHIEMDYWSFKGRFGATANVR